MLIRTFKVILTLFLLNFGFCSAMFKVWTQKQPTNKGIPISFANCNGRIITGDDIYKTVERGIQLLKQQSKKKSTVNEDLVVYHPRLGENMQFTSPYHACSIKKNDISNTRDMAVFTTDAKLVKVTTLTKLIYISNGVRTEFQSEDCALIYEMDPTVNRF